MEWTKHKPKYRSQFQYSKQAGMNRDYQLQKAREGMTDFVGGLVLEGPEGFEDKHSHAHTRFI